MMRAIRLHRGTLGANRDKACHLPPGSLPTLWNAEDRFRKSYLDTFPAYYETGDAGMTDEDGYVYIMARTDDVINVAGHRLSTGAMEEVLASHPDVAECAVIGIGDALKGQSPLGLVCLNVGAERTEEDIRTECVALIRQEIGPVAAFKQCIVVDALPKTRSGKILRRAPWSPLPMTRHGRCQPRSTIPPYSTPLPTVSPDLVTPLPDLHERKNP